MEGRYDAVRGHRTGSNKSPPLFVPVTPSPVSREASRDFVALDIYVVTYPVPDIQNTSLVPYGIPGIYSFLGLEWLG